MNFKGPIIAVCLAIAVITAHAQEVPVADTLGPQPMNPQLELLTESVTYAGVNIGWAGMFYPNTVFFSSGDDVVQPGYKRILERYADALVQNPDVTCEICGYYSPSIDDIDSPSVGEALAIKRAMAVREILVLRHPQLGLRVNASVLGYDCISSFNKEQGRFDMRVELHPVVSGWSPRIIISSPNLPYWRRGFRNIAEDNGAKITEILNRNPDLNLIFSSGLLEVPAKKAYERIETVVDKFEKEMNWEDESRLVAVHGGLAKPGEMLIDLALNICSPMPLERRLMWLEPDDYIAPQIDLILSADSLAEITAYRVSLRNDSRQNSITRGFDEFPTRLQINTLDTNSLLLPGDMDFSLTLWRGIFEAEQSDWQPLNIDWSDGYYEMAVLPMIPFHLNTVEPAGQWEAALSPVADRIRWLAKQKGEMQILVIGHALYNESDCDSLAISRAQYLWRRLGDRLIVLFGADDMEELGDKLIKLGFSVELQQELHSLESGATSAVPWAAGPIRDLPVEHLEPWAPFATIKWEFRCNE